MHGLLLTLLLSVVLVAVVSAVDPVALAGKKAAAKKAAATTWFTVTSYATSDCSGTPGYTNAYPSGACWDSNIATCRRKQLEVKDSAAVSSAKSQPKRDHLLSKTFEKFTADHATKRAAAASTEDVKIDSSFLVNFSPYAQTVMTPDGPVNYAILSALFSGDGVCSVANEYYDNPYNLDLQIVYAPLNKCVPYGTNYVIATLGDAPMVPEYGPGVSTLLYSSYSDLSTGPADCAAATTDISAMPSSPFLEYYAFIPIGVCDCTGGILTVGGDGAVSINDHYNADCTGTQSYSGYYYWFNSPDHAYTGTCHADISFYDGGCPLTNTARFDVIAPSAGKSGKKNAAAATTSLRA